MCFTSMPMGSSFRYSASVSATRSSGGGASASSADSGSPVLCDRELTRGDRRRRLGSSSEDFSSWGWAGL